MPSSGPITRRPYSFRSNSRSFGGSVRGAQFLVLASKCRALMRQRYHTAYEDIAALAAPILRHRVLLNFHAESDRKRPDDILKELIEVVPHPRD